MLPVDIFGLTFSLFAILGDKSAPERKKSHFSAFGPKTGKVRFLRFGVTKRTFCANDLNLTKFRLLAAPCRKAGKRNGILVILEPQKGRNQIFSILCTETLWRDIFRN